jgi:DNA-binding NarL/FixJ family response regulator
LKILKSEGCCGLSPVVIFSSLQDPSAVRAAYAAGAKLFMAKPSHLEGYADVARLCATCADAIRALPQNAVPSGALNVQRVLKLVKTSEREVV